MYNRLYKNGLFCIADYTKHKKKKKIVDFNTQIAYILWI